MGATSDTEHTGGPEPAAVRPGAGSAVPGAGAAGAPLNGAPRIAAGAGVPGAGVPDAKTPVTIPGPGRSLVPGDCPPGAGSPWWRWFSRWFFSAIWLAYLVQPVLDLFGRGHSAVWVAGGLALTIAFCIIYVVAIGMWDYRPALAPWGFAAVVGLAVLACLVYGQDWICLWIYASVAAGFTFQRRQHAALAIIGVVGCYALFCWLTRAPLGVFLAILLPVVLVGWAMVGFRMQITLMRELTRAREAVAKLAASEERLRLARDMHDLTGQSLSLVTLKSDLAARMLGALPDSAQRDAVLREISAIGQVSRQTLHDIRQAVSGYRRPTLAVEVITARTSLEAAGIHPVESPELTLWSGSFDPDAEGALAWCLREAVTNVIRHSGARNCRITLAERGGELSLEVSDDGRGFAAPQVAGETQAMLSLTHPAGGVTAGGGPAVDAVTDDAVRRGSGLHGMAERLSAVAGRFRAEPAGRDGRGFRIVATVPRTPHRARQAGHGTSVDGAGGRRESSGNARDAASVRAVAGASGPP